MKWWVNFLDAQVNVKFSVSIDINKASLTQMLLHQPHTWEKRYVKRSQPVNGVFAARKRSLGQGNIFSSVCQEFCPQEGGEVSASVHAGISYSSPWDQATPRADPPGPGPPGAVHAGRYGQWAGSMHPTGMQSCMTCFLNVFTEFANSVTKIFVITVKGIEHATSCVRDQDATISPARQMWKRQDL